MRLGSWIWWRVVLTVALLGTVRAAEAQTLANSSGLVAGTILLRGRIVGILPSGTTTLTRIGGHVQTDSRVSPEADLSYFVTDHIAVEGEVGVTQNTITAEDTKLGTVTIGTVRSVPILLMLQYHALPRFRWNPYAGAGLSILPYFDAQPAGGLVRQLSVTSEVGAALQAGVDYRISDRWYGNFDVKKLFVSANASIDNGRVIANGNISPWIIGAGIGYRF